MADIKTTDEAAIGCAWALIGLAASPVSYLWSGWVLSTLWGWFVVPTFHAPAISTAAFVGLLMVKAVVMNRAPNKSDKEGPEAIAGAMLAAFVVPALSLAVGYVAHRCM